MKSMPDSGTVQTSAARVTALPSPKIGDVAADPASSCKCCTVPEGVMVSVPEDGVNVYAARVGKGPAPVTVAACAPDSTMEPVPKNERVCATAVTDLDSAAVGAAAM